MDDEYLRGFGELADNLVTMCLGKSRSKIDCHSKMSGFYRAAREKWDRPITLLAAERLKEAAGKGENVILISNSYEMDGPPGVAALARAIDVGLGATPIIVTHLGEMPLMPGPYALSSNVTPQTCMAAGMMPVRIERVKERPHRVAIREFPKVDAEGAAGEAERILDEFNPAFVITSEAMGRNRKDVYHSAWGYAQKAEIRMDHILELAASRGIPSVSVGDNGNEMGFGTIEEGVRKYHPFGDKCQCPCGSGIATKVKADLVLPATTSNWGCYGIEACLAEVVNEVEVMHDGETERRMLYACANAGCPDGSTTFTTPTCDGTPHEVSVYIVELLRMTVSQSFKAHLRRW